MGPFIALRCNEAMPSGRFIFGKGLSSEPQDTTQRPRLSETPVPPDYMNRPPIEERLTRGETGCDENTDQLQADQAA
jgi:hypothetical protein